MIGNFRKLDQFIPPILMDYGWEIRRLISRMKMPFEIRRLFERNKKFHNIHKGERCFILATGPSINKQDLKPLKNEICIAVSLFSLHRDCKEINPRYHVDAVNHPPYCFEVPEKSVECFKRGYSEGTVYFFGHNGYKYSIYNYLKANPKLDHDKVYYLNYWNPPTLNEKNYMNDSVWDLCKPLFAPRTSLYCAIEIAAYMGFKEIYLLGCDHDYLAEKDYMHNISGGCCKHFYEEKEGFHDTSFLHPTEQFFMSYYLRWTQYRLMRKYLEDRGCYIFNATDGGLLDVFPRVNLENVIAVHTN